MENVADFRMVNSSVSLPLKLTGRHMEHVLIQDSTFSTLPWPGVFLHNSSHVEIVRNQRYLIYDGVLPHPIRNYIMYKEKALQLKQKLSEIIDFSFTLLL